MKNAVSKQTYLLGLLLLSESWQAQAAPFSEEALSQAQIGLGEVSYFERRLNFPQFTAHGRGVLRNDYVEAVGEADGMVTLNHREDLSYLFVQEAYVGNSSKFSHFSVGRKKVEWSLLDEAWKLGVWQPRLRWDYLQPQTAGLTGLFFEQQAGNWAKLTLFGSPVFIPEQGAPFQVSNGQFHSSSPWFSPPLSSLDLFGRQTTVDYTLHTPSIRQIVQQPSWGVSGLVGQSQGPWGRVSYAQKPVNQIMVDYDGTLDLSDLEAKINIYPKVVQHHVGTIESGLNLGPVRSWVSGLAEAPVKPTYDSNRPERTQQMLGTSFAAGPGVDWDIVGTGAQAITAHASYIRLWGGEANDQGPLSPKNGSVFESRFPYRNAFNLGMTVPFYDFTSRGQFVYDTSQKAAIVSGGLQYHPGTHWVLSAGADLIGVEPLSGAPQPRTNMIRRFQTNDRAYGGVSYVF